MNSGNGNLDQRHVGHLVERRIQNESNRQNFDQNQAPTEIRLYRPDIVYPRETELPYPVEEGSNYQQAHMTYGDVEADDMSMAPLLVDSQPVVGQKMEGSLDYGQQSASGFSNYQMNHPGRGNLRRLSSPDGIHRADVSHQRNAGQGGEPSLGQNLPLNNGASQQSASGLSNDMMNTPGGHLQVLSSTGARSRHNTDVGNAGSGNGMDRVVDKRNIDFVEKLKSEVKDYDDRKEQCFKSFIDGGFNRDKAEAYATGLLYLINVGEKVQCLCCLFQADITDKFQHRYDCVVYGAMRESGYPSSDEDSLPQKSDSDVSMESEDSNQSRRELPANSESEDSLFRSGNDANVVLPTDGKSVSTIKQLEKMGYEHSTIQAVFDIYGPTCLNTVQDFLEFEVKLDASIRSNASSYTSVAQCPPSTALVAPTPGTQGPGATWSLSDYATAGDYSQRETPVYSFSTSQGGGDVLQPPTFDYNFRGQTVEITGDGDVSLDYQYCLACKRERACVNQVPCGHVVCKRCGDRSNRFCRVPTCRAVVTQRGYIDIRSMP